MTNNQTTSGLLLDHVDARPVSTDAPEVAGRNSVVRLDPDHPGFRDSEYRARRNRIARIASDYRPGSPVPDAPYTDEENELWRTVMDALAPAHRAHACAEYLASVRSLALPRRRIPQLAEVSA